MKILHGTWIPQAKNDFIQTGQFYLWLETSTPKKIKNPSENRHPFQVAKEELATLLTTDLGLSESNQIPISRQIVPKYFLLPSTEGKAFPSLELQRYLELEPPETLDLQSWEIDCYPITSVIKILNDLHFLCVYNSLEIQLGSDLLFWYHYTQAFNEVIFKDQYIPALKYRELYSAKTKGNKKADLFDLFPTWEIISQAYETNIKRYIDYMPKACLAGFDTQHQDLEFYEPESLLRHFSESLLNSIIADTPCPATFEKKISESSFLKACILPPASKPLWNHSQPLDEYRKWQSWKLRNSLTLFELKRNEIITDLKSRHF